jgi:hypothetical protein
MEEKENMEKRTDNFSTGELVDLKKPIATLVTDFFNYLCKQKDDGDKTAAAMLSSVGHLQRLFDGYFKTTFDEVFFEAGYYACFHYEKIMGRNQTKLSLCVQGNNLTNPVGKFFTKPAEDQFITIALLEPEMSDSGMPLYTKMRLDTRSIAYSVPIGEIVPYLHEMYLKQVLPVITSVNIVEQYFETFSQDQQTQLRTCVQDLVPNLLAGKQGQPLVQVESIFDMAWRREFEEGLRIMRGEIIGAPVTRPKSDNEQPQP